MFAIWYKRSSGLYENVNCTWITLDFFFVFLFLSIVIWSVSSLHLIINVIPSQICTFYPASCTKQSFAKLFQEMLIGWLGLTFLPNLFNAATPVDLKSCITILTDSVIEACTVNVDIHFPSICVLYSELYRRHNSSEMFNWL